jgi:hypothetical protein
VRFVVAVSVPERDVPEGLLAMLIVTGTPATATERPVWVCNCTVRLARDDPATTLGAGWAVKASLVGLDTVTVPLAALGAVHDRYTAVT